MSKQGTTNGEKEVNGSDKPIYGMVFQRADKKVLAEKRNHDWLNKHGMTPKRLNDMIVAKAKAELIAQLAENFPTASELEEMLGFQSTVLDDYGDVVELTDGRLVKESK